MKIATKHASNSHVTHKRFAVFFFLPSCGVNSLTPNLQCNGYVAGWWLVGGIILANGNH